MGKSAVVKSPWTPREREAWELPESITVSEWADEFRVLDERTSAEPGSWRTSRTPYLREVLDAWADPWVEEITLMFSTQVGKTETLLNCLGYVIDQDPGPTMMVQPIENMAKEFSYNRVRPMLEISPALARHLPAREDDLTKLEMRLERMSLYFAGANSPAGLASRPIRYLLLDEVDKYPKFSGREADPIKLSRERTKTFWNRKIVKVSTPTTREGYIFREYERGDRRRYHVPCPHCGRYQVLAFGAVKWPEGASADEIAEGRLAWAECTACGGRIEERHKGRMLGLGVWAPEGCEVGPDGAVRGACHASHRSYWLSALYSPWVSFSEVAAEFLRSKGHPELLMNFINSWLAEIWEERTREQKPAQLKALRLDYAEGVVPDGALLLSAGVDVQESCFYLVIRAWGYHEESWLVRASRLETWDDVFVALVQTHYARAGSGQGAPVRMACVDSGYNAPGTYEFCRRRLDLLRPTKGQQRLAGAPVRASKIDVYHFGGKQITPPGGLVLYHLDTTFLKDKLSRLMDRNPEQPGGWHLFAEASEDYLTQMCSEQKVIKRNKRTGVAVEEWGLAPGHRANHYWDCEVYALAAAEMRGVSALRPAGVASIYKPAGRSSSSSGGGNRGFTTPDGRPFVATER